MNKKAMAAETVQKWIIGLVSLIVLLFAVYSIARYALPKDDFKSLAKCRTSIELLDREKGNILTFISGESNIPFSCETDWHGTINVTEEKEEKAKEQVIKEIVPLLRNCWYQFGEGKLYPFADFTFEKNSHCFVCSRFVLPDNFEYSVSRLDLNGYMDGRKDPLTKKYYLDLFGNAFPNNNPYVNEVDFDTAPFWYSVESENFDTISIEESKDYGVIFWAYEYGLAPTRGLKEFGYYNTMFIVPYDLVEEMGCSILEKKSRTG